MLALVCVVAMGGVAVVGLVVAVSGDDPAPFDGLAGRYQQATASLQSESEALRTDEGALAPSEERSLAEILRVYDGLRAATERARDAYVALEVPSEMAATKRRLVDLVTERVSVLRRLIQAAEMGDQATVGQSVRDLVSGAQPIGAAQAELRNLILACGSPCR